MIPRFPNRRRAYTLGLRAETLAALLLRLKGYHIVARRFAAPVGEIDLVVRRGNVLVFVEVKARQRMELALEAIRPHQRRRIARGAEAFLAHNPHFSGLDLRFDAVLVTPGRFPRHLPNAFESNRPI